MKYEYIGFYENVRRQYAVPSDAKMMARHGGHLCYRRWWWENGDRHEIGWKYYTASLDSMKLGRRNEEP